MTNRISILRHRATNLGCVLIQEKPGVILAKRLQDDSYITWAYQIDGDEPQAHFYWGHYDMDLKAAMSDYESR